jgi:hypothetical protein
VPVELEEVAVATGEHVVQFYEDDPRLAHTVGRYLTAAVEEGAVVVAIATVAHRRMFEGVLEAAELDPVARRQAGTLVLLDAAETLAGFLHNGRVDDEDFRRRVAPVLREAVQTGRPVRAYGEMVALLWEAGNVQAAIELEESWNSLAQDLPFALVCGYRSESVQGDANAGRSSGSATCTQLSYTLRPARGRTRARRESVLSSRPSAVRPGRRAIS